MLQEFSALIAARFCILGLALGLTICFPAVFAIASELRPQASAPATNNQNQTDPQVKAVIDRMTAAGVLHPMTVEDVRRAYAFYQTLSGKPEQVFGIEDRKIPGPAGEIPIRVYVPNASNHLAIFVFFHGGGFVAGNLDTEDTPLRAVANRCGCIVVSVAYRLAPENPYPAAPDDAFAATKWVAQHATELGGDARRLAVGGDGAGGNLAAVIALMARDRSGPRLMYQVLIYPDIDAIMRTSRFSSHDPIVTAESRMANLGAYVPPSANVEDPYVSPIYSTNLEGLPPALLITDQDDPAWDEGSAYADRLRYADVPVKLSQYPNMIHGFFLMAGALDAGEKCIDEVAATLRQAFKDASTVSSSAKVHSASDESSFGKHNRFDRKQIDPLANGHLTNPSQPDHRVPRRSFRGPPTGLRFGGKGSLIAGLSQYQIAGPSTWVWNVGV